MATTRQRRKKTQMSEDHLQALANGRNEGAIVRRYLTALENHKPKRGRKRTPESMERRLKVVEQQLSNSDTDPLTRVHLVQERMDLLNSLEASQDSIDLKELEDEFVKAAKTYGERKNISYAAWREVGVDAAVLKRAGIKRSGQ